jgi:hypothetical protein
MFQYIAFFIGGTLCASLSYVNISNFIFYLNLIDGRNACDSSLPSYSNTRDASSFYSHLSPTPPRPLVFNHGQALAPLLEKHSPTPLGADQQRREGTTKIKKKKKQ